MNLYKQDNKDLNQSEKFFPPSITKNFRVLFTLKLVILIHLLFIIIHNPDPLNYC